MKELPVTKEECVIAHREMWDWLIKEMSVITEIKFIYLKVGYISRVYPDSLVKNNCFGCHFAGMQTIGSCEDCFFKVSNTESQDCLDGLYNKFMYAYKFHTEDRLSLAEQIRDFPIKNDIS